MLILQLFFKVLHMYYNKRAREVSGHVRMLEGAFYCPPLLGCPGRSYRDGRERQTRQHRKAFWGLMVRNFVHIS